MDEGCVGKMKLSIKKGLGFGLTSGIITTLGMIVGFYSGTHSIKIIIGGILLIALSDSLSDAFGIHISEEINKQNSDKHIWESTFSTLIFKIIFALSFTIPFLLFNITTALTISLIWGLGLIAVFSYYITPKNESKVKVIGEHLFITIFVIIITYLIGQGISGFFG